MQVVEKYVSADGAVKRLHKLDDGNFVESVILPHTTKVNLCLSTQVGCKMRCSFCQSGKSFTRNLTVDEILGQIDEPVDSLVFMGMGEPLDNPNLLEAINRIIKEKNIAPSKITVSTSGILDKIDAIIPTRVNLAFSVHATTDEQRMKIMPINRKYPLEMLKTKMNEIDAKLPSKRRLQIQYTMIKGFNDSPEDITRLASFVPKKSLINLIPVHSATGEFTPPTRAEMWEFKNELRKHGYIVYVRESRGFDVNAACGMLAGKAKEASTE
jgi:23S rRNA (adenine2503-C2)-methyltransferase